MNTISLQTYTDNWAYLNKENMASIIKEPKVSEYEDTKAEDERKIEQISESNKLSNEEKLAVYFNLQAVEVMKNRIDIYMDEGEENSSLQNIYELNRKIERNEFIQNFQNDSAKIQNGSTSFEMWA